MSDKKTIRRYGDFDEVVAFEQVMQRYPDGIHEGIDWSVIYTTSLNPHMIEFLVRDNNTSEYVEWDLLSQHESLTSELIAAFLKEGRALNLDLLLDHPNFTPELFDSLLKDSVVVQFLMDHSLGHEKTEATPKPKYGRFREVLLKKLDSQSSEKIAVVQDDSKPNICIKTFLLSKIRDHSTVSWKDQFIKIITKPVSLSMFCDVQNRNIFDDEKAPSCVKILFDTSFDTATFEFKCSPKSNMSVLNIFGINVTYCDLEHVIRKCKHHYTSSFVLGVDFDEMLSDIQKTLIISEFSTLFFNGYELNQINRPTCTLSRLAIIYGSPCILRKLLRNHGQNVFEQTSENMTLLHEACRSNDRQLCLEIISEMANKGSSMQDYINSRTSSLDTPLHFTRSIEVAELMIRFGATRGLSISGMKIIDPDLLDYYSKTMEIEKKLDPCEFGSIPYFQPKDEKQVVFIARGLLPLIMSTRDGPRLKTQDMEYDRRDLPMTECGVLLEKYNKQKTVTTFENVCDLIQQMSMFIYNDQTKNFVNMHRKISQKFCIFNFSKSILPFELYINSDMANFMNIAISLNRIDIVKYLATKSLGYIDMRLPNGWTPLHYAVYINSDKHIYDILLQENKSNLMATSKSGVTPVNLARSVTVFKSFLEKCRKLSEFSAEKSKPLFAAADIKGLDQWLSIYDECIQERAKLVAESERIGKYNRIKRLIYICTRHDVIFTAICETNIDVNMTHTNEKNSLLHLIVTKRIEDTELLELVYFLLNMKADPNIRNSDGKTVLQVFFESGVATLKRRVTLPLASFVSALKRFIEIFALFLAFNADLDLHDANINLEHYYGGLYLKIIHGKMITIDDFMNKPDDVVKSVAVASADVVDATVVDNDIEQWVRIVNEVESIESSDQMWDFIMRNIKLMPNPILQRILCSHNYMTRHVIDKIRLSDINIDWKLMISYCQNLSFEQRCWIQAMLK